MAQNQQRGTKRKLEDIPSTSQQTIRRSKRQKKIPEPTPSTSTSKNEESGKFTDFEKVELFNGLIQHGSANITALKQFVPKKSEDSIKRFIYQQKRIARYSLIEGKPKSPIDEWLEYLLQDANKDREKIHDISRALKYIYLFESPGNTNEDMIKDSYKLLSDFMRGDQPKHLDPVTSLFLHRQISELIRVFKTKDFSQEHKHLETFQKKKPTCYSGKRKVPVNETNEIYPKLSNPLKVPDSLLVLKK